MTVLSSRKPKDTPPSDEERRMYEASISSEYPDMPKSQIDWGYEIWKKARATRTQPIAEVAEDFVFMLRNQDNGDRWPVGTKLYGIAPQLPTFEQTLESAAYGGIPHNDARIRCARAVYLSLYLHVMQK